MSEHCNSEEEMDKSGEIDIADQSLELHITDDFSAECYKNIVSDIVSALGNSGNHSLPATDPSNSGNLCTSSRSPERETTLLDKEHEINNACKDVLKQSVKSTDCENTVKVSPETCLLERTLGKQKLPHEAGESEKVADKNISYCQISLNKLSSIGNPKNLCQGSLTSYFGLKGKNGATLQAEKKAKEVRNKDLIVSKDASGTNSSRPEWNGQQYNGGKKQCPFYKKIPGNVSRFCK